MKQANTSFEIRAARDYLAQLVHGSFDDYVQNSTSSRAAIACAVFIWHLHDWVWAQYKDTLQRQLGIKDKAGFAKYLLRECEALQAISAIANGSKHFQSDAKEVTSTQLQHGFYRGLLALGTASHFTVEFHGQTVFLESLLRICIEYWDRFFENMPS